MARTITLAQLRTAVLARGGIGTSTDLTPAVLNDVVNGALAELWDILISKRDGRTLKADATLVTVIGVDNVALPVDFYQLRKLEIVDSTSPSGYRRLRPVDIDASHLISTLYGKRYRYRRQGSKIILHPTPLAVESLRLFYSPWSAVLAADGDTFDGISGYEELAIQIGWKRCLVRRDLDTTGVDREIARLTGRIEAASDGADDEPMYLDPNGPPYDDWGSEWP